MVYNLFTRLLTYVSDMMGGISQYLKCSSMCCTNINIDNPNSRCTQGEIFNRWVRATTPSVESPTLKKSQTVFFTPKNK